MDKVQGLKEYVHLDVYRHALGLPPKVEETYEMLAQGEYNRNYVFTHPITKKKLVLRVNFGSQMHLRDQIEYEYRALKRLESSGRTPKVLYVDGSCRYLKHGVLVMECLPGHSMNYETELFWGAGCLADIHSVVLENQEQEESEFPDRKYGLLAPENPLKAILEECEEMFRVYEESPLGDAEKKRKIRHMLDLGWERVDSLPRAPYKCCINTELNSTNFLINGEEGGNYLVDWEKPLYGDPAQDLGHFLAPTTTFWKTDVILTKEQVHMFLAAYKEAVAGRFDVSGLEKRTEIYIPITCLRGITWCAMAWVQYQEPGKELVNESTWKKLEAYLEESFLDKIKKEYLQA